MMKSRCSKKERTHTELCEMLSHASYPVGASSTTSSIALILLRALGRWVTVPFEDAGDEVLLYGLDYQPVCLNTPVTP